MDSNVHDQITAAIAAHGKWKTRLKSAIGQGTSEFAPATVRRHDACDFGKWLQSAGPGAKSSPHYGHAVALHAQFHEAAAEVLALALAGKKAEAEAKLGSGSAFAHSSAELTREMSAWLHAA
jgi:methyl-accepting chemotaxis protein